MNRTRFALIAALCGAAALFLSGCPSPKTVLEPTDPKYKEAISAFFSGTLALQVSDENRIEAPLKKALELLPGEPAAWANMGVYQMRTNQADAAAASLKKAQELAPDSADIAILEGSLYRQTGKFDLAQAAFERAAKIDSKNLKAYWLLADIADQQRGPDANKIKQEMYGKILDARPNNLAAQIEQGRTLAVSGDKAGLAKVVAKLTAQAPSFPKDPQLQSIVAALPKLATENPRMVALRLSSVKNLLVTDPNYKANLAEVQSLATGDPIPRLIKTQNPSSQPAPSDTSLKYAAEPLQGADAASIFTLATPLNDVDPPAVFALAGAAVKRLDKPMSLPIPQAAPAKTFPIPTHPLCALDYDGDFRGDLAIAGGGGLRLYHQKADGGFEDATTKTKLPPTIIAAAYSGVWAVDIEADGDLDLILSPASGDPPVVLQNNGDGTFTPLKGTFPDAEHAKAPIRSFVWADFDSDGDPDAAFVDANGNMAYYSNERSGRFKIRPIPIFPGGKPVALAVANVTNDTRLSLLILNENGSVNVLSDKNNGADWEMASLPVKSGVKTPMRLFVADLDNNGSPDLIIAGQESAEVFLSDAPGKFARDPDHRSLLRAVYRRSEQRRPAGYSGSPC